MFHWIEQRILNWLVPSTAVRGERRRTVIGHLPWRR